jgi:hypothetical protein
VPFFSRENLWWQLWRLLDAGRPAFANLRHGKHARQYRKIQDHLMATQQSRASAQGPDSNSRLASAQGQN